MVGPGLTCLAVEGWFLSGDDVAAVRERAGAAVAAGAGAVIVREGPAGDPLVLAGALVSSVPEALLAACVGLDGGEGETGGQRRHPTVLARDMTSLDLLCGGRSLLCLEPPFGAGDLEAVGLCRSMWDRGTASSPGPIYPVPGAVNRPRPAGEHSPAVALDLTTEPDTVPAGLVEAVDFVLRPGRAPHVCRLEQS